jgi:hypothetical protein
MCSLWLLFDCCLGSGRHNQSSEVKQLEIKQLLNSVTNKKIEFITTGVEGATLPTMGRRVVVTGPPEVVELLSIGDVWVLDKLIGLLRDPDRAWAAEVALASLTHHEEEIANAFATRPGQWQDSLGKNAFERWNSWLKSRRNLVWDSKEHAFMESGQE